MPGEIIATNEAGCAEIGYYWYDGACHSEPLAMPAIPTFSLAGWTALELSQFTAGKDIIEHGADFHETWTKLALMEPPDDVMGRIIWSIGVLGQLVISLMTFPAALAAFLLEEAVQSYGMGAYMLTTAGAYEQAQSYMSGYHDFIAGATAGAKTLATLSPITGGAVLQYMTAAAQSAKAFDTTIEKRLADQVAEEYEDAQQIEKISTTGQVRISSSPSGGEIWMNGQNTEQLTPQTFKNLKPGSYTFQVRRWDPRKEYWRIQAITLEIEAGRKKEILIRLPADISGDTAPDYTHDETDEPILPPTIKTTVEGEYAIDGDTFITATNERIRILGIDAPELGRPFADESRTFLQENIEDKNITITIYTATPLDAYGRTLAVAKNYKGNIAIASLGAGLSRVDIFEDSPLDRHRYDEAEQTAKARKVGIWSEI